MPEFITSGYGGPKCADCTFVTAVLPITDRPVYLFTVVATGKASATAPVVDGPFQLVHTGPEATRRQFVFLAPDGIQESAPVTIHATPNTAVAWFIVEAPESTLGMNVSDKTGGFVDSFSVSFEQSPAEGSSVFGSFVHGTVSQPIPGEGASLIGYVLLPKVPLTLAVEWYPPTGPQTASMSWDVGWHTNGVALELL